MTESRKKAMRKAKKQSAKPQPKPCPKAPVDPLFLGYVHEKTGKIMWKKAGHAFSNSVLQKRAKKEVFNNEVSYAKGANY